MSFLPDEVLELRASNEVLRSLVQRAAELLRDVMNQETPPYVDIALWLQDAGVEGK